MSDSVRPHRWQPTDSPVPGILKARTLEWVAISFSNAWKWEMKVKSLSRVWLLATPWTVAHQAPLSMGFSRQEYWSGVPLPSPSKYLVHGKAKTRTQTCMIPKTIYFRVNNVGTAFVPFSLIFQVLVKSVQPASLSWLRPISPGCHMDIQGRVPCKRIRYYIKLKASP